MKLDHPDMFGRIVGNGYTTDDSRAPASWRMQHQHANNAETGSDIQRAA
jgi:hypothetical protein